MSTTSKRRRTVPRASRPESQGVRAAEAAGKRLRVVVLTQPDSVAIPANIEKIAAMTGVELVAAIELDVPGALANKKTHFARGFGLWQSARFAAMLARHRAADLLDRATPFQLPWAKRSVRAAAAGCGARYMVMQNPNSRGSIDQLEALAPDLIVSFSAPCVLKPAVLSLPPLGCINLHCSELPAYAGLLPSFWVLFNGESTTGATVHYIDENIDSGPIVAQARVPIPPHASMHDVVRLTKQRGGDLMVEAIERLGRGDRTSRPNQADNRSYYTWPTVGQIVEFRRAGGRLI